MNLGFVSPGAAAQRADPGVRVLAGLVRPLVPGRHPQRSVRAGIQVVGGGEVSHKVGVFDGLYKKIKELRYNYHSQILLKNREKLPNQN